MHSKNASIHNTLLKKDGGQSGLAKARGMMNDRLLYASTIVPGAGQPRTESRTGAFATVKG